ANPGLRFQFRIRGSRLFVPGGSALSLGEKMKIGSIVIRCYEFNKMLAFWREALHYVPREAPEDGWVVLCHPRGNGPNISLDRVPERRSGKKNKLHLDLYTTDQQREVERLIKLGAKRFPWKYPPDADFVKLADPDGNHFCVVQKDDA
ncbi:MAG TPA: VOC family protein, partial [Candidatus Sulfotelmatobacter sp.]|nr:VOC family protein [Candidatus Sulfotelmatobacter sp.]